jgi:hypothetical protein
MFDEIPEVTYEKIGIDYIGSAVDENGNIIFSRHLQWERFGDAFAGRELSLKMKDGSITKIKDHWFDWGCYEKHGEFVNIGAGTLESLQDCYVYFNCNINKDMFQKMLEDYYSIEKEYDYDEIEKWAKLQYKWYNVIINGKEYPYMVNKNGDFVDKYSKEPIYARCNRCNMKYYDRFGKTFYSCLFELNYKENGRLIKIERKMIDV